MHIEKREREKIDRRIIKEKKRKAKNLWKIYAVVFFSLSSSKKNKNINKRNPGCVQSDELIVPILYPLICRPRVKMRRISVRLLYNLLLFIFVPLLFTHKQQKKKTNVHNDLLYACPHNPLYYYFWIYYSPTFKKKNARWFFCNNHSWDHYIHRTFNLFSLVRNLIVNSFHPSEIIQRGRKFVDGGLKKMHSELQSNSQK